MLLMIKKTTATEVKTYRLTEDEIQTKQKTGVKLTTR